MASLFQNHSWGCSNSHIHAQNEDTPTKNLVPPPPPPPPPPTTVVVGKKRGRGGGGEADHDLHIWTERERRKKMRNMFSDLHALLPTLPPKADKSSIVDEAMNYIKTLEQTLEKLEKQKIERNQTFEYESREAFLADRGSSSNSITPFHNSSNSLLATQYPLQMFQTWTSSNVVLNICGNKAQFCVCSPRKKGLLTTICYVLEKHKIEVISAHVSSDSNQIMYMIQGHAGRVADQFPELLRLEDIYKQAAGEMTFWVSS